MPAARFAPRPPQEAGQILTILGLVAAGLGVAVVALPVQAAAAERPPLDAQSIGIRGRDIGPLACREQVARIGYSAR